MSHDHDHEAQHDQQHVPASADSDSAAPGRASRSAELRRSSTPVPSGIVMRHANGSGVEADHEHAVAQASASGGGGALPDELRSKFESSLGVDLGGVRVHTGAESAQAATAVGAHAYALGNDIHFAPGQYDPSSERGQHLIAHEVAHTVQQRGAPAMRQNKLAVSSPGDVAEVEADRAADAMVAGRSASIASMPSTSGILHRSPSATPTAPANGEKSAGGGIKVSNSSVEISLSGGYDKPFSNDWVTGTCGVKLSGKGMLKFPSVTPEGVEGEVGVGADTKTGHKAEAEGTVLSADKINLYTNGANEAAKAKSDSFVAEMLEVESVEWVPLAIKQNVGASKGNDDTKKTSVGGDVSMSMVVKFKKRPAVTFALSLAGLKFEGGLPSISGPTISGVFPIEEFPFSHDYGGGYSIEGNVRADCTVTASPALTQKLVKKATEKAIEKFAQKAGEKVVETAAEAAAPEASVAATLNTAAIAEIAGFGAIAVSMGAALVIGTNQVEAIKDYAARGRSAIAGYVAGAMAALGVPSGNAGDPMYFIQGQGAYAAKLNSMMAGVKAKLPAGHNLSDAEIMGSVMREVQANAANIRAQIEGMAQPAIAKAFAEAYYRDNKGWIFQTEDRRDAERVATRLGDPTVRIGEDGTATNVDE